MECIKRERAHNSMAMPAPQEEQQRSAVQQVMSAQALPAGLPNGLPGEAGEVRVNPGGRPDAAQQRIEGVGPERQAAQPELQATATESWTAAEAIARPMQVEPERGALTTLDLDRRSTADQSGEARNAGASSGEFRTPMAVSTPQATATPTWLAKVEPPRWLQRLGSFLNVPAPGAYQADLAPSPFPGGSPPYTPPPPGGQPFRLRSPGRPRAIPAAPTPPSSSSIPAEAIQAEVQRQLGGILSQLRDYGERNERLQSELDDTRRRLRAFQEQPTWEERETLQHSRLLGDLANAPLDPGNLEGLGLPREGPDTHRVDPGVLGQVAPDLPRVAPLPQVPGRPEDPSRTLDPTVAHEVPLGPPPQLQGQSPSMNQPEAPLPEGATGLLRSWWGSRQREQTPPPKPHPGDAQGSPVLDALTRGVQQLQELQAQALSKSGSPTAVETVKPGTVSLTMMPEAKDGADAALAFQDWLEVSYAVMCDLSEGSSVWWTGVMEMVDQSYANWLSASPIEKLAIEPRATEKWCGGKWTRVNARASSMLLTAMPADLRSEMVSRRYTNDCVKMMFKLFTAYQPGGSAERHDVLRRLQAPLEFAGGDTLDKVLRAVRAWPCWLERCKAVQMTPPDPSVLARGLLGLTSRHIESSSDASFRTSMLRATLRLDARPTLEQVQAYQRHLQAELEVMALSSTTSTTAPKVLAVEPPLQPKARDAGAKGGPGDLCRYFAKASGCRRGDKCNYSHSMAGLDKEQRAKKCLKCGSESHRQKECPVGRQAAKSSGSGQSQDPRDSRGQRATGYRSQETSSTQSTTATIATTTPTSGDTIAGTPWTLEALVQAAQQVVQGQGSGDKGDSSPEKTKPEVKTLILRDLRVCSLRKTASALVDSGATHSLRTSTSAEEWESAEEISFQLAGCHYLTMRITSTGTLLMPPHQEGGCDSSVGKGQTIVPMGQLIKTLGYKLEWTPEFCYLESPEGHCIDLHVDNGCPQMKELEALSLIARLEDRKLEELGNAVLTTKDKLKISAVAMARTWDYYLLDYVTTGSFESGLRAVRDAPFFSDLPGECLRELIPAAGLWSGWDAMKNIGFLTRPQRRKLWGAKKWVGVVQAGQR